MKSINELLAAGRQHFDNKRYDEAEGCLRRILEHDVKYADVFNMLGVISHVSGRFASAIDFFSHALEINPNYTEAMLNLAVIYNDLGQHSKAKDLYNKLRRGVRGARTQIEPVLRGKLSNLHADIGDIYRSIGLYSYATEEYKKALALNANYFDIRTKLGRAYRENGNLANSMKELRKVLRANDTYAPALVQMGITYYAMGKTDDAKKSWRKALAKSPQDDYAKMYLKLCEAMSGASGKMNTEHPTKSAKKKGK